MSHSESSGVQSSPRMPQVDRVAANRAAVAARQARAALKRAVRAGELSPLTLLDRACGGEVAAGSLRITDFLLSLPGIGEVKANAILQQLRIAPQKRLGGLGRHQVERLRTFLEQREPKRKHRIGLTVLAGPTAVGKGTVAAFIRENFADISLSVSATTRPPRPGEVEGVHYFFVSDDEFDRMIAAHELLEYATVHNAYRYGTPLAPIVRANEQGRLVLLEIDLAGARQVRASLPDARLIFLEPPSWDELVRRLVGRGTESAEEQERRLATARVELAARGEFDYVIVNDSVERAAKSVVELMRAN